MLAFALSGGDAAAADGCQATAAAAAAGRNVMEMLDLDRLMAVSTEYWLRPSLPDENVMFADVHWEVIKRIIPAYDRFVNLSTSINRSLSADFDVSTTSNGCTGFTLSSS